MHIHCCNCNQEISARLTDGIEIYPHRSDLANLPFWKCDTCKGVVGCHHQADKPYMPLGVIPSPEIKKYRNTIHQHLDPLWREQNYPRKALYKELTKVLGRQYHTAELRTVDECKRIVTYLHNTYGSPFLLPW